MPNDEVTATALCRRLLALKLALEDMPKQAKRYVREVAKRKAVAPGPKSVPPLRMGLSPGYRKSISVRSMKSYGIVIAPCGSN